MYEWPQPRLTFIAPSPLPRVPSPKATHATSRPLDHPTSRLAPQGRPLASPDVLDGGSRHPRPGQVTPASDGAQDVRVLPVGARLRCRAEIDQRPEHGRPTELPRQG